MLISELMFIDVSGLLRFSLFLDCIMKLRSVFLILCVISVVVFVDWSSVMLELIFCSSCVSFLFDDDVLLFDLVLFVFFRL